MHIKLDKHTQFKQTMICQLEDQSETDMHDNSDDTEINVSYTVGEGPLLLGLSFWNT